MLPLTRCKDFPFANATTSAIDHTNPGRPGNRVSPKMRSALRGASRRSTMPTRRRGASRVSGPRGLQHGHPRCCPSIHARVGWHWRGVLRRPVRTQLVRGRGRDGQWPAPAPSARSKTEAGSFASQKSLQALARSTCVRRSETRRPSVKRPRTFKFPSTELCPWRTSCSRAWSKGRNPVASYQRIGTPIHDGSRHRKEMTG